MLLWGGLGGYPEVTDVWESIPSVGAARPRRFHSTVWTGKTMILWGGIPGRRSGGRTLDPPGPEHR